MNTERPQGMPPTPAPAGDDIDDPERGTAQRDPSFEQNPVPIEDPVFERIPDDEPQKPTREHFTLRSRRSTMAITSSHAPFV